MTKTNLVLLTGLPAAGKSTVAQRLVRENGFAILSTDDLRQSLFQQTYEELAKDGKRKDEVVRKIIDYSKVHKVIIQGLDVNYLLPGNDIVINDLEEIEVEEQGEHIYVKGKQKK